MENLRPGAVIITTEEYADLVEYRYAFELLKEEHEKIKKYAILNVLNLYAVETNELHHLLNFRSYVFPIEEKHLLNLLVSGITQDEIFDVIKQEKRKLEWKKKEGRKDGKEES